MRTSSVFALVGAPVAFILYLGLGLFQIAGVTAGIEYWLGIHWFFAGIIAVLIAWSPIVGTVLGMVGAHYAWGWSWLSAFLLFWGPLIVIAGIALAAGTFEKVLRR